MGSSVASDEIVFYINGKKVIERQPDPEVTLLYYIRNKLHLTGTKAGCNEGGCGACTVMLSRYDHLTKEITHFAVAACLIPLCSVNGLALTTVEGIGSTKTRLHPVQERLAKSHGTQCGFCSPGMVMSMYSLLRNNPQPSEKDMERALQGNLCRCTGYRPILDGFKTFTKEYCCGGKANCCKNDSTEGQDSNQELFDAKEFLPLDPTQEPIFPPELMLPEAIRHRSLHIKGDHVTWIRPSSLQDFLDLRRQYPQAKLMTGRIRLNFQVKSDKTPVVIETIDIPEFNVAEESVSGITIGSSVTVATVTTILEDAIQTHPEHKTRSVDALLEACRRFGGQQIRNMIGVGACVMSAGLSSDLKPVLIAAKSSATVISTRGVRRDLPLDESFFLGQENASMTKDEFIVSINVPFTEKNEFIYTFKQSRRREVDAAIVNACMRVRLDMNDSCHIKECCLAFGGLAMDRMTSPKTSGALIGKLWNDNLLEIARPLLEKDFPLAAGSSEIQPGYPRALVLGFFFKFYLLVTDKIAKQNHTVSGIQDSHRDGASTMGRLPHKGVQSIQEVPVEQPEHDAIGRPLAHLSALEHATGEASYCDDIPPYRNELYVGLVLSERAHARIVSIDTTEALKMPGVHSWMSSDDMTGPKTYGVFNQDDRVFYDKEVTSKGQIICAILADTKLQAQRAAKTVKVEYEDLPAILNIEAAIEAKSFFQPEPSERAEAGDLEAGFRASDHVITGEMKIGSQDHFYMETQVTIAVPKGEHGEMEVFCASQHPDYLQIFIADLLGVPRNRIVCRTKRLGGGFGGKQFRFTPVASVVAVAAKKTGRPVRCMLDRDENMKIIGMRSPFLAKYKVGFSKDGKIQALDLMLYVDAGYSLDVSAYVLKAGCFGLTNAYHIPNIRVAGYVCKTNLISNTGCRGFGRPQVKLFLESWINDVASKCGLSQRQVREINFLGDGAKDMYNQPMNDKCTFQRVWDEVIEKSDFERREIQIKNFNRANRWRKRGISIIPTKSSVGAADALFFNQAGALVHVYTDGSVLVTHGGIEMGQGLHTKMVQVAARVLNLPVSKIFLSETATDKVPNPIISGASFTADTNGMAIKNACEKIMSRIALIKQKNPDGKWEDWVQAAYLERVSLSATGFYKTPGLTYDSETNQGSMFPYYTYGAACSEVEIDCLTGDHQVIRTDIVMDAGRSLNPALEVGQVEGGFVQGQGFFTIEDVRFSEDGTLLTTGPNTYKIPSFADIPAEFNVHFLKNSSNEKAIYSSKGTGEVGVFLGASVFFAIKNAVTSARCDAGVNERVFRFDSPATCERIRMACTDEFITKGNKQGRNIVITKGNKQE